VVQLGQFEQFENHFWRTVGRNYTSLEANPPDGHVPQAEVHLVGEQVPVPVQVVESQRTHSWVLLHSIVEGEDDPGAAHPSDRYIFVEQSQIARVEIRYVRKGRTPTGFSVRAGDEVAE
jgi:hypothetical protein